jgi:hypothetical protein
MFIDLPRASWTVPYLTAYFSNGSFNVIIRVCHLIVSIAHIKTAIMLQLVALCGCSLQHSWSYQCLPPTVLLVQQLGSLWFVVEMKDWTGIPLDWLVGAVVCWFNNCVSSSGHVALNVKMAGAKWTGGNEEGIGHSIRKSVLALLWRGWGKSCKTEANQCPGCDLN